MGVNQESKAIITKYAVKNAIDYGKADIGSVLGKVINVLKGIPINELRMEVEDIVNYINKLNKSDLEKEYTQFKNEFDEMTKEKAEKTAKPKMIIEGAKEGEVVTRFPPEPGGYIHIGNMKQCILSDEFAKIYKGKIHLYFDDTNPEKCKQEYVEGIKNDTDWMEIKFDREYYASDFIEKVYDNGRKLIEGNNAYVCFCDSDTVKNSRKEGKVCIHRKHTKEQNIKFFDEMLNKKYKEGEAIVRLKGDMESDNDVFRDPTLFRVKMFRHYRQGDKYVVWPTYHMNTPIIDSINGVTDVIRGKEYEKWGAVHKKILDFLGLRMPRIHYEARLNIAGTTTAKRDIRRFISEGVVEGWDDPRLVTIIALKRRGIQPEAIRNFVLRFGLSKTDSVVSMDMLLSENKKIIEQKAKHLFFVKDPVKLMVKNTVNNFNVKLQLHPNTATDFREYNVGSIFYISGDDAKSINKNDTVRLKDLFDIEVISNEDGILTAEIIDSKKYGKIIQWVSENNYVKCSILIPESLMDDKDNIIEGSLKVLDGYVESYSEKLVAHEIVQFERFGYVILDKKDPSKLQFIFTSK